VASCAAPLIDRAEEDGVARVTRSRDTGCGLAPENRAKKLETYRDESAGRMRKLFRGSGRIERK
jgi:hypothetical protein